MSENKENKKQIALKPYTLKELSELYGVDWRTLKSWLQPFLAEIGEKKGRYYQIPQVRVIFKKLDLPSIIEVD
ncbi:MAG TPA: MerR family transcriptional regulator [Bacteroidia bacterium]|nr:MerR family transcriptional regulator [Bacteroidia bacterium]